LSLLAKAFCRSGEVSLLMHDCAPEWSPQHRQSVPSEKLTFEFARYSVHKHFYGKPGTKFQKNAYPAGKRSGFYTVVSIIVSKDQLGPMHFDDTSDSHSIHKEVVLHSTTYGRII
jgi:hypothetical protein